MDSQAKYCLLVWGDGGVYLQMLVGSGYKEKIRVRVLVYRVSAAYDLQVLRILLI